MTDTTRRRLLAGIGGAAIAAVAGCSQSTGSGGNSTDGGSSPSVITGTEIVESDEISGRYNLAVDLVDDHGIDQLSLQNPNGGVHAEEDVNAAQTRVEMFVVGDTRSLSPDAYEIISYSDDTPVTRQEWVPTVDVAVKDVKPIRGQVANGLTVVLENEGEIAATITDAQVTEGYPVSTRDADQVGELGTSFETVDLPIGSSVEINIIISQSTESLLAPPEQTCGGRAEDITAAVRFEEINEKQVDLTAQLGGEYQDLTTKRGCTNLTVTDWETV